MAYIIWALVIGTSIWVYFDAKALEIPKEGIDEVGGQQVETTGPVGWAVFCLVLWIVAFPLYLIKRGKYKREFMVKKLSVSKVEEPTNIVRYNASDLFSVRDDGNWYVSTPFIIRRASSDIFHTGNLLQASAQIGGLRIEELLADNLSVELQKRDDGLYLLRVVQ